HDVDAVGVVARFGPAGTGTDHVAHVLLPAAGAGDVPAAPTLGERASVVGAERPASEQRIALPVYVERADEVPGESLVGRRAVAEQAGLGLPLDDRPFP